MTKGRLKTFLCLLHPEFNFRFRKRWPEPKKSLDCERCARKISTRYNSGQSGSGTRRIRNKITDRIRIERIGPNGSRLVLSEFDPDKDSGVYRCFAHRSIGPMSYEPIFVEAEVRALDVFDWCVMSCATIGQSYKASMIVIYDSRVVPD